MSISAGDWHRVIKPWQVTDQLCNVEVLPPPLFSRVSIKWMSWPAPSFGPTSVSHLWPIPLHKFNFMSELHFEEYEGKYTALQDTLYGYIYGINNFWARRISIILLPHKQKLLISGNLLKRRYTDPEVSHVKLFQVCPVSCHRCLLWFNCICEMYR